MKKILFLLIACLYGFTCMAQQTALTDTVSIRLPDGAKKINREQSIDFVKTQFDNYQALLYRVTLYKFDYRYEADHVLLLFSPPNNGKKISDDFLLVKSKPLGEEHEMRKRPNRTTEFKTINNNQVLIVYDTYKQNTIGDYDVYCINGAHDRYLHVVLNFDLSYKEKAKKMVDDILQGLKFTK